MQTRFAAALVVLFALPISAQVRTAGEHVQVTLVEVPVNVVDRNGDPIRNLTAENFQLLDNGKPRPITHFDAVDLLAATAAERATLPPAAANRNFLLVFDLSDSAPSTLARAKEAARTFVSSPNVRADRIGVGTFSADSGFHLLASFTTDMRLVQEAITSIGSTRYFQAADPLLLSANEMREALSDAESEVGRNAPVMTEELREDVKNLDNAVNAVNRQFIRRMLDGYADLAQVLDRVPGRKQVILLSEGFDAKMIHGRESLNSAEAFEEQRQIQLGESWRVDTDNRYGDPRVANDLKDMLEACRRSDVVLNAIDIRGIRTDADLRYIAAKSNESLFLLTHDTGGTVFKNSNALEDDFKRLLHMQEVVYVLGFEAPSSAPGKFHDLKVKLVNVPGAHPFHRAGYFEMSPAKTPIERTLTAGEILVNQIPSSDLPVAMLATPFPRRAGRAQVPVIVEIDGPTLLRLAKGNQIQSEVFIYAFDGKNVVADFVHQPIGLDVSKLRDRLQQKGVRVYETLMLPPGRYSVRTLVRTGGQSIYGYDSTVVTVPAYGEAAVLGGSAVDDQPGRWVPVKPPDRKGVPSDYPFLIGGAMLVPSASPVLQPGTAARLGLYVAGAPADLNVTAAIDGKEMPIKIAGRTAGDGTSKLLLEFVPPSLPPGAHVLKLGIPSGKGGSVTEVPFVVR